MSPIRDLIPRLLGVLLAFSMAAGEIGCQNPDKTSSDFETRQANAEGLKTADTGFTPLPGEPTGKNRPPAPPKSYDLSILHVLIPREGLRDADKVWNYVREDAFNAETQIRFRENGLRVGVGHAQWWEPIKAVLDAIEGHKVTMATPVHLPIGYPLLLELDSEPQEQTLFYVGADGILTGNTWPESRNVLRVTYAPDAQASDHVILYAVPEVYRQEKGWEWVRSEAGLRIDPSQSMEAFSVVGLAASLAPGEFLLIAPSENARIYGLLGGAFFTRISQGQHLSSFVFLRPEAREVDQHD